jgi:hypothetical protein
MEACLHYCQPRHGRHGVEFAVVVAAVLLGSPAPALYGSAQTAISPGTVVYLSTSRNGEPKEINLALGSGTCPPQRAGRLMGAPKFAADGEHHGR